MTWRTRYRARTSFETFPFSTRISPIFFPPVPLGGQNPLELGVRQVSRVPEHRAEEGSRFAAVRLDVDDPSLREEKDRHPVLAGDGEGPAFPLGGDELEDVRDAEVGDLSLHPYGLSPATL